MRVKTIVLMVFKISKTQSPTALPTKFLVYVGSHCLAVSHPNDDDDDDEDENDDDEDEDDDDDDDDEPDETDDDYYHPHLTQI